MMGTHFSTCKHAGVFITLILFSRAMITFTMSPTSPKWTLSLRDHPEEEVEEVVVEGGGVVEAVITLPPSARPRW